MNQPFTACLKSIKKPPCGGLCILPFFIGPREAGVAAVIGVTHFDVFAAFRHLRVALFFMRFVPLNAFCIRVTAGEQYGSQQAHRNQSRFHHIFLLMFEMLIKL
ncbi:hypothetical protein [Pantoea stewartii]|nr:hypothetical protein [Pantoea stewartii]